jgi:regulator of protease activity HflC (stomatin/prohibitin superfamily)
MQIEVLPHERAFVLTDGRPTHYLAPGVYRSWPLWRQVRVEKYNVAELVVDLDNDRLRLMPSDDVLAVKLEPHERAVVFRRGRPMVWLGAGLHFVWAVDRAGDGKSWVTVQRYDTSAVECPTLRAEVAALVHGNDYVEVTGTEGSAVLRWVDGQLDAVLPAGRYAAWSTVRKVQFTTLDLKERQVHVSGQEVMTKDRVTLRLNVSAGFRVKDARRQALVARNPDEAIYLSMQLAVREAVTSKTLDELLAAREALAAELRPGVQARADSLGLDLLELGIKDVVLPGEMKDLLNKVIAAQKQAEANVILRREETQATRSLAQTAKVLQENPLLVRLKELEAYAELAGKVGALHVFMGQNAVPALQLTTPTK